MQFYAIEFAKNELELSNYLQNFSNTGNDAKLKK
jgi:hypothetical protein